MIECGQDGCPRPAQVALRTGGRDSVRGINTTVYYEPENAPRGSEPLCAAHGVALVTSLIGVLA